MDALTIALRAVHFAAVIALFGEFAFLLCVAQPALRENSEAVREERLVLRRRFCRVTTFSLAAAVASGILWFAVQSAAMSGAPFDRALDRETLDAVLNQTLVGRVWEIRFALALALAATLLLMRRAYDDRIRTMLGVCGGLLAGGLLATLAWAGHAAAEQGADRMTHLAADALHLLAAGAWLGALLPLVFALGRTQRGGAAAIEVAARATRRFSLLGVVSIGTLVVTGTINAWYTVGTVPALFGTSYGELLMVKLFLFAGMVSLAAINRTLLTPQLVASSGDVNSGSVAHALCWLRRNAIAETTLGLGVVGIVGALGLTVPALHVQPIWPFSFTFDWEAAETLLPVPANPTTYFRSPIAYTAASIARGGGLYAQHCVACHGVNGYGDGPVSGSLASKPADLTRHIRHHRDGDLFWWLQHGISGTPMPGFGGRVSETGLWDTINFLHAQAEAENGRLLNDKVEPWRPIVAPDFTFQIDLRPQESLKQHRGRHVVLLVLYTLPDSLARLESLNVSKEELEGAGVRAIAVPMSEEMTFSGDASVMAAPNPQIVIAYSLFGRRADVDHVPPPPTHMEFLIDRQGYLRARWMSATELRRSQISDLLRQVEILNREKPRLSVRESHAH